MTGIPRDPLDRTQWPDGPWMKEPDRVEFRALGFPCLMVRNPMGNWCGYVGVAPGHPWFEKGYDDVPANAHGGLTFSNHCHGNVCHVPQAGEPDHVWWLGFDCAHYMDLVPGLKFFSEGTYKDEQYVRAECEALALQASEAK